MLTKGESGVRSDSVKTWLTHFLLPPSTKCAFFWQLWSESEMKLTAMSIASAAYFGALSGLCALLILLVLIKCVRLSILTVCLLIPHLDVLRCKAQDTPWGRVEELNVLVQHGLWAGFDGMQQVRPDIAYLLQSRLMYSILYKGRSPKLAGSLGHWLFLFFFK